MPRQSGMRAAWVVGVGGFCICRDPLPVVRGCVCDCAVDHSLRLTTRAVDCGYGLIAGLYDLPARWIICL